MTLRGLGAATLMGALFGLWLVSVVSMFLMQRHTRNDNGGWVMVSEPHLLTERGRWHRRNVILSAAGWFAILLAVLLHRVVLYFVEQAN